MNALKTSMMCLLFGAIALTGCVQGAETPSSPPPEATLDVTAASASSAVSTDEDGARLEYVEYRSTLAAPPTHLAAPTDPLTPIARSSESSCVTRGGCDFCCIWGEGPVYCDWVNNCN